MIKVSATHGARSHVLDMVNVFRARVVDVGPESLTIEITGGEEKIDRTAGSVAALRHPGNGANRHRSDAPRRPKTEESCCIACGDRQWRGNHRRRRQYFLFGLTSECSSIHLPEMVVAVACVISTRMPNRREICSGLKRSFFARPLEFFPSSLGPHGQFPG